MKYFENSKFNIKEIEEKFNTYIDNKYPLEFCEYQNSIMKDIFDMVKDNYKYEVIDKALTSYDPEIFAEVCESDEWGDSIHGNASGSYFMNRSLARECICNNYTVVVSALLEFFGNKDYVQIPKNIFEDPEYIDVTVRLYYLPYRAEEFFWWWWNNVIGPYMDLKD